MKGGGEERQDVDLAQQWMDGGEEWREEGENVDIAQLMNGEEK